MDAEVAVAGNPDPRWMRLLRAVGAVLAGGLAGGIALGAAGMLLGAFLAFVAREPDLTLGSEFGLFVGAGSGIAAGLAYALIGGRAGIYAAAIAGGCANPLLWTPTSYTSLSIADIPLTAVILLVPFAAALRFGRFMASSGGVLAGVDRLRAGSLLPRTPLPVRLLALTPYAALIASVVRYLDWMAQMD